MTAEFMVAGHSHIFAMGAPQNYQGAVDLAPIHVGNRSGFFLMEKWGGNRTQEYWDRLVAESPGRDVLLAIGGNEIYIQFLLAANPLFDVYGPLSTNPSIHPGARIVPRALIADSFRPAVTRHYDLIPKLFDAGALSVAVLGTPAPRSDYSEALDDIRESKTWKEIARSKGVSLSNVELTPGSIMLKFWAVYQEVLLETAAATGARFIPTPQESIDESGFRSIKFCGPIGDFTHGNSEYGRLVLQRALTHTEDHDFGSPL